MERKWTNEQQLAIDHDKSNILVSAAAGSGKTAVLVERIIKKITRKENAVDIDSLLVMTFTNAAAMEMKERISVAISKEIDKNPLDTRLQKQLIRLNKADITTMHSFCNRLIKKYFHLLDIDPSFRIGDENECKLIRREAVLEVIEDRYDEENMRDSFLLLAEGYTKNKSDVELEEIVLSLYSDAMAMSFPERDLNRLLEKLDITDKSFEETIYCKIAMEEILDGLKEYRKGYKELLDNLYDYGYNDKVYDIIKSESEFIEEILSEEKGFFQLRNEVYNFEFLRMPAVKGVDEEGKALLMAIRDGLKKYIKSISEKYFYFSTEEEIKNEMTFLHNVSKAIIELVIDFKKVYEDKKKKRGILDYNDLEHYGLDILVDYSDDGEIIPSNVALELREKYSEVLIDEYQDTIEVQVTIIIMIGRVDVPNIFMVGDVKQSIYRFRNTNPQFFLQKYYDYSENTSERDVKILLYKNFRSRKEVLTGINFLFKRIMSKELGDVDYTDVEALNPGASFNGEGEPIDLVLLDYKNIIAESDDDVDKKELEIEAKYICNRIENIVSGKEQLYIDDASVPEGRRIPTYKDIVILLRATAGHGDILKEALMEREIPVFLDSSKGCFDSFEINIMMSLLEIIDNPLNDIPLMGVLRSPIGSFDEEELIKIRGEKAKGGFYNCLKKYSKEENFLGNKAKIFLEKLKMYREKSIKMNLVDFLWYLYLDTNFYSFVATLSNGNVRQENLMLLLQKGREFENTSYKGLFNFINFINKIKISKGDFGSAITIGENENVVRIMSIHKSKGLEFPIVFMPHLNKKFNMMDLRENILFHPKLGFGPKYISGEERISHDTLVRSVIKDTIETEVKSEEMRILYVALTRAKEKLILLSANKDIDNLIKKGREALKCSNFRLPSYMVKKCSSYLQWIIISLMAHKDGNVLRERIEGDLNFASPIEDDSKWNIQLIDSYSNDDTEKEDDDSITVVEKLKEDEIGDKYEAIDNILNFRYKYKDVTNISPYITVSEIKRKYIEGNIEIDSNGTLAKGNYIEEIVSPKFLRDEKSLTRSQIGTAHHTVMEHLPLKMDSSEESVKYLVDVLVNKNILSEEEGKVINCRKISDFLRSDLCKDMIENEETLLREFPIQLRMSPSEVYDVKDDDDKLVLNGIVDAFYEKDNELIIVDYKSDYYVDKKEMVEKYKVQLRLYKKALEKITGKKVRECILYLFFRSEYVKIY